MYMWLQLTALWLCFIYLFLVVWERISRENKRKDAYEDKMFEQEYTKRRRPKND